MTREWQKRWGLLILALAFEGSLVLLAWALGLLFDLSPWASLEWQQRDFALGVLATLPLLAVFALCVLLPGRPLARIRQIVNEVIRPFFAASSLIELAAIALVAGAGEEMLFRGVIQTALGRWLGPWPGIVAASALFGALHLITLTYGLLVTLVGIYLGWCYAASGNLLGVIVAHALYDFLALAYLTRGPELQVDTSSHWNPK